jgi:hypothetical protein
LQRASETALKFDPINLDGSGTHIHSPGGDNGKAYVAQVRALHRDSQYRIALADGGSVTLDIFMSGIADTESYYGSDREQLYIGREGNDLTVQFSGAPEDYSEVAAGIDEATRVDMEAEVRARLAALVPGASVDFTNSDNWDCITGLYTSQTRLGVVNSSSLYSSGTDDLMADLENQAGYQDIRAGLAERILREVLTEHNIAN